MGATRNDQLSKRRGGRWLQCLAAAPEVGSENGQRASLLVFGAGSHSFNGLYYSDGANKFRKVNGEAAIVFFNGWWLFNGNGGGASLYGVKSEELPATGWKIKHGQSPAPQVFRLDPKEQVPQDLQEDGWILEVAGAGRADFDGFYSIIAIVEGRAQYQKEDGKLLIHRNGFWMIEDTSLKAHYTCRAQEGAVPPENAVWECTAGPTPAPVVCRAQNLSVSQQGTQISEESRNSCDGFWYRDAASAHDVMIGEHVGTISGTVLQWFNGDQQDVTLIGNDQLSIEAGDEGEVCLAQLCLDNGVAKLLWRDGDVWYRVEGTTESSVRDRIPQSSDCQDQYVEGNPEASTLSIGESIQDVASLPGEGLAEADTVLAEQVSANDASAEGGQAVSESMHPADSLREGSPKTVEGAEPEACKFQAAVGEPARERPSFESEDLVSPHDLVKNAPAAEPPHGAMLTGIGTVESSCDRSQATVQASSDTRSNQDPELDVPDAMPASGLVSQRVSAFSKKAAQKAPSFHGLSSGALPDRGTVSARVRQHQQLISVAALPQTFDRSDTL